MMKSRIHFTRLMASIACLAVTMSVLPIPGRGADAFEINAIISLTGSAAFLGTREATTLSIIENLVNKSGGIKGRPIKFIVQDDQSNPSLTLQLASSVIAKRASIIIGPSLTATCGAVAPILKAGPVLYCLSPGFHGAPGSYAFNANPSNADSVGATVRYLHDRGLKRVGVIASTDAAGEDGNRAIKAAVAGYQDMTIISDERFNGQDVSVVAQIARIAVASPDVLIVWTTGPALGTVLRGIFDVDLNIPIATTQSNAFPAQLKTYAKFMPKELFLSSVVNLTPDPPVGKSFQKAVANYHRALADAAVQPEVNYSLAWDATWILLEALKNFGLDATPDQIRSYIENLHGWVGADGEYDFRGGSRNGLSIRDMMEFRWDPAKSTFISVSKLGGAL